MIHVHDLVRAYGRNIAVKGVSFDVPKGQTMGLLGSPGAGKTSVMHMLAGCLEPTSGEITVGGEDMVRHAAARRLIGYLPEKTPLYPDMTAREYLRFVCELKRVPRERCVQEVERVCAFMQLKEMDKLIGFLPEAARRRLGLAQMLVGDPPVLIFDEPTFGLDPRATAELRASIKEMSRGHTVVLASRLLHEVTELCEAVVVINRGRLAVNTPIVRLSAYAGDKVRIRVRLQAAPEQARRLLTGLAAAPEVESLPASEEGAVDFIVESEEDVRGALWDAACAQGIRMLEMKRINVSLEDVFLQLTGDVQEDGDESGF